jgi:hypothetical protein
MRPLRGRARPNASQREVDRAISKNPVVSKKEGAPGFLRSGFSLALFGGVT